jgi:diguanylate cyclase (GGDEF)-like protein
MQRDLSRRGTRLYWVLAGLYLLLLLFFMTISVFLDVRREKDRFAEEARYIHSYLDTVLNRNLIALNGFAALLKVGGMEKPQQVAAYARFVREHDVNIHRLEIAQTVKQGDREGFVRAQRERGLADFQIKFLNKDATGQRWTEAEEKVEYFPLLFMEPLVPVDSDKLGQDLGSVAHLRDAVEQARRVGGPVASRPFRLDEGEMAYVLVYPIHQGDQEFFAISVCKARNLLPRPTPEEHDLAIGIFYQSPEPGVPPVWLYRRNAGDTGGAFAFLFPELSESVPVGGPEQALVLQIDRQLDWRIVNEGMLITILVGGLVTLPLLLASAKAHHNSEMHRLEEGNKLFYLANFDALTGLPNRQLFVNRLDQALAVANRQGLMHAVLFLDLDSFKDVNDYYGHQIGDKVLQRAARLFLRSVREIDTVARFGGDEFVILLQNVDGRANAEYVARKIKRAFQSPSGESSKSVPIIGTSIGIAVFPEDGLTADELLNTADVKMYQDKISKKTRTEDRSRQRAPSRGKEPPSASEHPV